MYSEGIPKDSGMKTGDGANMVLWLTSALLVSVALLYILIMAPGGRKSAALH